MLFTMFVAIAVSFYLTLDPLMEGEGENVKHHLWLLVRIGLWQSDPWPSHGWDWDSDKFHWHWETVIMWRKFAYQNLLKQEYIWIFFDLHQRCQSVSAKNPEICENILKTCLPIAYCCTTFGAKFPENWHLCYMVNPYSLSDLPDYFKVSS